MFASKTTDGFYIAYNHTLGFSLPYDVTADDLKSIDAISSAMRACESNIRVANMFDSNREACDYANTWARQYNGLKRVYDTLCANESAPEFVDCIAKDCDKIFDDAIAKLSAI
jgi:hypothetical protein